MIVLARIDNRLIHGQVLEAWVPHVQADCIVVASDEVAHTALQCLIMQAAVPSSIKLVIATLEDAAVCLASESLRPRRVLLLFANAADALHGHRLGMAFARLNLGNLHAEAGKCRYSTTVALDQCDIDTLQQLAATGVTVVAQAVPAEREQGWEQLLRNGSR